MCYIYAIYSHEKIWQMYFDLPNVLWNIFPEALAEKNMSCFWVTGQWQVYYQCTKYTRQKHLTPEISSNVSKKTTQNDRQNWKVCLAVKIKLFLSDSSLITWEGVNTGDRVEYLFSKYAWSISFCTISISLQFPCVLLSVSKFRSLNVP